MRRHRPLLAVLIGCASWGPPTWAAVLRVPDVYPTIQAAVNDAAPGDEVMVAPGTYEATFIIAPGKRDITIRGDGTGEVRCGGGAAVHGTNISIADLKFVLGDHGVYIAPGARCALTEIECWYQPCGVLVDNSVAALTNVACYQNTTAGIYATGAQTSLVVNGGMAHDSPHVTGLLVRDGARAEVTGFEACSNSIGLWVRSEATATFTSCVADHNTVGLQVTNAGKATAIDCEFSSNREGARCIGALCRLTLDCGVLASNSGYGVYFGAGAHGAVRNTEIANSYTGIAVHGSSPVIEDNWLHDHLHAGVCMTTSQGVAVRLDRGHVTVSQPARDAVAAPIIAGNRFERNRDRGICIKDSSPANAGTLLSENTFAEGDVRIGRYWAGAIAVRYRDAPVELAHVTATSAAGFSEGPYRTDAEGFLQKPVFTHKERWMQMIDYIVQPGGTVVRHNPYAVEARSADGTLRGSCVYSWDGQHKSEGFDVDGRYQVAIVELNARPTADAGPDRTVPADGAEHASVVLDASASTDADDDALLFTWREGEMVLAGPADEARVTVLLAPGAHAIDLVVDDGHGDPGTDQTVVTVAADR